MDKKTILAIIVAVVLIGGSGVFLNLPDEPVLLLATTTSTYDSGLLDEIIPGFEEKYGVRVKIIAVGTGQALELGRNGDVDVMLVHSPAWEIEFVEGGYGGPRKPVMYNQLVIVGSSHDPVGIKNLTNASQAFTLIEKSQSIFVSRGDDSGTHNKERDIWETAGYDYASISGISNSDWYMSVGQGMGDTLRMASEVSGYTLADEGSFYSLADELELEILARGDPLLFNQYSVIPINATLHPHVQTDLAAVFIDWLVSDEVQEMIGGYTRDGRRLFMPNAEE